MLEDLRLLKFLLSWTSNLAMPSRMPKLFKDIPVVNRSAAGFGLRPVAKSALCRRMAAWSTLPTDSSGPWEERLAFSTSEKSYSNPRDQNLRGKNSPRKVSCCCQDQVTALVCAGLCGLKIFGRFGVCEEAFLGAVRIDGHRVIGDSTG